MLKKDFVTFLFLLYVTNSYAKGVPKIPEDCFSEDVFCQFWKVLKKNNNENPHGKRVSRITFFAQLDSFEFEDYHGIIEKFNKYEKWPDFTENSYNVQLFVLHQTTSTN